MREEPGGVGSTIFGLCLSVFVGAVLLWAAVAIVQSIWVWLLIFGVIAGTIAGAVRWWRARAWWR